MKAVLEKGMNVNRRTLAESRAGFKYRKEGDIMSLFDRKIVEGTPEEGRTFFGIVKSGAKTEEIGVIDEDVLGEIVGCFTKYSDGQIDKLAEIKVDIDPTEEFDPKKVKLQFVAEGEKKAPRDLKGYKPGEVFVQAFYDGEPVDEALLQLKLAELVFPEPQPQPAPAPAPTPQPAPQPAPTPVPVPASPAPIDLDEMQLFFRPGEDEEELVTSDRFAFWCECLERGFVAESDFEYRYCNKVLGNRIVPSAENTETPFRTKDLKAAIGK